MDGKLNISCFCSMCGQLRLQGVVTLIPKLKKGCVLAKIPMMDATETTPSLGKLFSSSFLTGFLIQNFRARCRHWSQSWCVLPVSYPEKLI